MARGQNKPNAQLVTTTLPTPKQESKEPSLSNLSWPQKVLKAQKDRVIISGETTDTLRKIVLEPLNAVESIIADEPDREHAAVYKDGVPLIYRSGKKGAVDFTSEELRLFKGTVITHNHPSGSSFSRGDVLMLKTHGMKELRAVDVIDKTVRSISPPKDSVFWKTNRNVIAADHDAFRKQALNDAGYSETQVMLGLVPTSVQVAVINASLDALDKKYNLGYTRTKL